jgi:hypothetical protein
LRLDWDRATYRRVLGALEAFQVAPILDPLQEGEDALQLDTLSGRNEDERVLQLLENARKPREGRENQKGAAPEPSSKPDEPLLPNYRVVQVLLKHLFHAARNTRWFEALGVPEHASAAMIADKYVEWMKWWRRPGAIRTWEPRPEQFYWYLKQGLVPGPSAPDARPAMRGDPSMRAAWQLDDAYAQGLFEAASRAQESEKTADSETLALPKSQLLDDLEAERFKPGSVTQPHLLLAGAAQAGGNALPEYDFFEPVAIITTDGANARRITVKALALRIPGHFLQYFYVPTVCITSLFPFFLVMPPSDAGDRVNYAVLLLLVSFTFRLSLESALPTLPYDTVLDTYLKAGFYFLMAAAITSSTVTSQWPLETFWSLVRMGTWTHPAG